MTVDCVVRGSQKKKKTISMRTHISQSFDVAEMECVSLLNVINVFAYFTSLRHTNVNLFDSSDANCIYFSFEFLFRSMFEKFFFFSSNNLREVCAL